MDKALPYPLYGKQRRVSYDPYPQRASSLVERIIVFVKAG